jgi:uncharacterized SAM-binding protein YcdF (DUF218 family)
LGVLALFVATCILAFFQVGYFLDIPSQQPVRADLIVPLGGDNGNRVNKAAELFKEGLAPYVLLTGMEGGSAETRSYYLNWRARFLIERGVAEKMLLFDATSANTWEEAVNTLRLMRERNWQRVLVVSDPPHMRRLAWVWGKVFEGSGKEYRLIAAPLERWNPGRWWENDYSAQYVFTEVIKFAYYKVAH